MVKDEAKVKILSVFVDRIKRSGVDVEIKIEDYMDDCCIVEIPSCLEGLGQAFFDGITDDLMKLPEVENLYDTGRGGMLRKSELRRIEINTADGFWYESEEDKRKSDEMMRYDTDPEYRKQKEEEERQEKLSHWRDYLLPIPEPPPHYSDEVYLTMAYEPYDLIKSGEKVTEFRAYTPNYAKRLLSHPVKTVKFQRGYGGPGRPKPEQMVFEVKRIDLYDVMTRTSADPFNPTPIIPTHFAIDLGRRIR